MTMNIATIAPDARKGRMSLLAKTFAGRVVYSLDAVGPRPDFTWPHPPEASRVTLRGRIAGRPRAPLVEEV